MVSGVPQSSILGPILFIVYATELRYLLQSHGVFCHFYADDTQIYFKITDRNHNEIKIKRLITEIQTWMTNPKINTDKTEMIIIRSPINYLSI